AGELVPPVRGGGHAGRVPRVGGVEADDVAQLVQQHREQVVAARGVVAGGGAERVRPAGDGELAVVQRRRVGGPAAAVGVRGHHDPRAVRPALGVEVAEGGGADLAPRQVRRRELDRHGRGERGYVLPPQVQGRLAVGVQYGPIRGDGEGRQPRVIDR